MYTKIAKPSTQNYTKLNVHGILYDSPTLTYDDPNTFYDGINENQYTKIGKPLNPELITNGTFAGNALGWNLINYTYSNNKVTAGGGTSDLLTDDGNISVDCRFDLKANCTYKIMANINGTNGVIDLWIWNIPNPGYAFEKLGIPSNSGNISYIFTVTSDFPSCYADFYSYTGFDGTIDNISVKKSYINISKPV